ncbi:AraC family transcriptional regulator [Actinomadura oligospora]|uniref:AraC family transcriptional regulator n=1 Tax=Actinomadura oligospora TaxID=111804 RepID=UPI0004BB925A|nr:AraC family transcriptional regulator [Actinomadura oligospora]
MDADLLGELLDPLRLSGVFHSRWRAHAPWGVVGERDDCALLHYVQEGECVIEAVEGVGPVRLHAGDLAVFPHGDGHRLGDASGGSAVPLAGLLPARRPGAVATVEIPGDGPVTTMLCGGLHYEAAAASPLYRALPPMLVLDRTDLARHPLLADTLHKLAEEWTDGEPGAGLVALRAFELVYVLALRAAVSRDDCDAPAVLRAMRDPAIGRALLALQTRYAEPWTLASLAAEAGLSRSAFAATFRDLVGAPPMRHLAERRMREAARLLTTTSIPTAAVAERVGYASAVGFHLAFRSWAGTTPGEYRRVRPAA